MERTLDLITMGRTILDVYGHQVGCGLEETSSFSKYVGGCPANIAIGVSRLGLRVGHITRVGEDHHGRFLKEQLAREGIDVTHVVTDPNRFTGVAFLGIRDKENFPLLHYRENCADIAIDPEDYPPDYIGTARALLVSGSHLTTEHAASNLMHAIRCAKARHTKVVFDIDYRPLFWRLVRKDAGDSRFVPSKSASVATQKVLPLCDLVVGTEEEIRIAGGELDTLGALRAIRALTQAPIVVKRGALGCVVFPDSIPERIEDGIAGQGFPVEIFNVVGAGDGFLAGFLSGWIPGADWHEASRRGNACGALVVSRHGCSPASATAAELDWFLKNATDDFRLHDNRDLQRVHRATTRRRRTQPICLIDCEAADVCAAPSDIPEKSHTRWMELVANTVMRVCEQGAGVGMMLRGMDGEAALFAVGSSLDWVVRRIDVRGNGPLQFEDDKPASVILRAWPQHQIVACRTPAGDSVGLAVGFERLRELQHAVDMWDHELMLVLPEDTTTGANSANRFEEQITHIHGLNILPDWWAVPAGLDVEVWDRMSDRIRKENPWCRGILALESSVDRGRFLSDAATAAHCSFVKGAVAGATVLGQPVRDWLEGTVGDDQFSAAVKERISRLLAVTRVAA